MSDHRAMHEALTQCEKVTVAFVFDKVILKKLKDKDDRRISFIHRSLQELDSALKRKDSKLLVLHGDPKEKIPSVAKKMKVDAVFANKDVEPYAKDRDAKVAKALEKQDIAFRTYKDHVIFIGDEILNQQGEPYKVFTPYKNKWLEEVDQHLYEDYSTKRQNFTLHDDVQKHLEPWTMSDIGFEKNDLWLEPGQGAAQDRLERFLEDVTDYDDLRNYPAIDKGFSGLSVHLRHGTISIRECVRAIRKKRSKGSDVWLSELIWRDFYHMILDQFPHVANGSFKEDYKDMNWPGSEKRFQAWCEGQTGYPIVDAAMRCINQTGWMHNRLRMIVAMFLTKDLLVDWQKGEAYFERHLLDFDLAANNGGWQWSASTGCDAQPYFRIFNPITQSEKFDPDGVFIRQYCMELVDFSDKNIHAPWKTSKKEQEKANCIIGKDYPEPIVDHKTQREKAIALFKKSKK
jgi:deoxyribodipyrimidine photo-lyase